MIYLSQAVSAVDPCSCAGTTAAPLPQREQLQLLASQQGLLESMLHCIQRGWMPILVGPTASGKTSLVRLVAQLAGKPLSEVVLTSGTDTSDLLGGFEQLEPSRKLQVGLLWELHTYPAALLKVQQPSGSLWSPQCAKQLEPSRKPQVGLLCDFRAQSRSKSSPPRHQRPFAGGFEQLAPRLQVHLL